ncbi:MAG: hypothetical protein IID35_00625 [Planctomycetes bacterium]|nr:hypothetical protein [Planctomycetota bacterium]
MNRQIVALLALVVGGVLGWSVGFLTFNDRLRAVDGLRTDIAQLETRAATASGQLDEAAERADIAEADAQESGRAAQALQMQLNDTRARLEQNADFDALKIPKTWLADFSPEDYSRNYIAEASDLYNSTCKGMSTTPTDFGEYTRSVRTQMTEAIRVVGYSEYDTDCIRHALSFAILFPKPLILENRIVSDAELFTQIAEEATAARATSTTPGDRF